MNNQHRLNKSLIQRSTFIALISFVLNGCLLDIAAENGGNVHQGSENGELCNPECSIDTADANGETYVAVAQPGFKFDHWDGATAFCSEKEGPACTIEQFGPIGIPLFDEFEMELTAVFVETDITPPIITINGENPEEVEAGGTYTDAGATATDNVDGDITDLINTQSNVDTSQPGSYKVNYDVSDTAGNPASATRVVYVVDTTAPIITIKGENPKAVEAGDTYTDAGATAVDIVDGDLTGKVTAQSNVDTSQPGKYAVVYTVTDAAGNSASEIRVVYVVDTTAPIITIKGKNPKEVEAGGTYMDAGATATDNVDGDLTAKITAQSDVDTSQVGVYSVVYTVSDAAGNSASATRVVNMVDTIPPIITIKGNNPEKVKEGDIYTDAGASAVDIVDGDLTGKITAQSNVDTSQPGQYEVVYTVSDAAGISASEARVVNVVENKPPVADPQTVTAEEGDEKTITLTGTDPEDDPLSYIITGQPTHGQLTGTAPNLTYSQTDECEATDSFTFKVNDGKSDSADATVAITIICEHTINTENQTVSVEGGSFIDITLAASDSKSHDLTYEIEPQPTKGQLTGTAPNVTYTPDPVCDTSDSFNYTAFDDYGVKSALVTVSVNITCGDVYEIAGDVIGLDGGTVVLDLNGVETVNVSTDEPFVFDTQVLRGGSYSVSVDTQPDGQICSVSGGSGTATGDVFDIVVECFGEILSEDWELGQGFWSASNGQWQVGEATIGCYEGKQCAATILGGNHGNSADSRLASAGLQLPLVAGEKELHLRYQHRFSYSSDDYGRVQIQTWDSDTESWGSWTNVGGSMVNNSTWTLADVNLTAYAGQRVKLGFYHNANCKYSSCSDTSLGWYIDDINIVVTVPEFAGDFEMGWDNWSATRGVWQIGTPSSGPSACYSGEQCAATYLNGNHPNSTDSSLVSNTFQLPSVVDMEEIHLRYQHKFSYSSDDYGRLQILVWDSDTESWGSWINVGGSMVNNSTWTLADVNLTDYADKLVKLRFYHYAHCKYSSCSDTSWGWFIDDINIVVAVPEFSGDFEAGWDNWSATRGVWQIGTPSSGSSACYSGELCAATYLNGNHPNSTDSSLVSNTFQLPSVVDMEEIHLRYQHKFSYSSDDYGRLQILVWDSDAESWGSWINVGGSMVNNSTWTLADVNLTDYADKLVKLRFYHYAHCKYSSCSDTSWGWFIDDINIVIVTPEFAGDFEMGWDNWSATRGVWQIGTPSSGPGACYSGEQCAATYLGGKHPTNTDSYLVSTFLQLPSAVNMEEVHLRFQTWYSYSSDDYGQVQMLVWDPETETWGSWIDVGSKVQGSSAWTLRDINLTVYEGKLVKFRFYHYAHCKYSSCSDTSTGWYIDDIDVLVY